MQSSYVYDTSDRAPAYEGAQTVNVNLILEGGAMRGQFTAGVLDFFMDQNLWCEHVIGTSAGALNGYNYVAGELGRTCFLNTKYCDDPRYLSMKNFVRTAMPSVAILCSMRFPKRSSPLTSRHFANLPWNSRPSQAILKPAKPTTM